MIKKCVQIARYFHCSLWDLKTHYKCAIHSFIEKRKVASVPWVSTFIGSTVCVYSLMQLS